MKAKKKAAPKKRAKRKKNETITITHGPDERRSFDMFFGGQHLGAVSLNSENESKIRAFTTMTKRETLWQRARAFFGKPQTEVQDVTERATWRSDQVYAKIGGKLYLVGRTEHELYMKMLYLEGNAISARELAEKLMLESAVSL
jgi:hypothetical protein